MDRAFNKLNRGAAGIKTAAALCAALLCLAAAEAGAAEGKYAPKDGRILVFAGQNNNSFDEYVNTTKIIPAGFMIYTSVQAADGLDEASDYGAGESSGRYLLDKYPGLALQIGLYMVDALDGVVAGDYDKNLDRIGAFIASSKRPVYLRIGYEFDGPHNHYTPSKYIKAYHYIVDRFRNSGIDNIAYVWHSYASFPPVYYQDWYPGDAYVDWCGISFFSQHSSEFKSFMAFAKTYGKPVMIAESTPSGIGTKPGQQAWDKWFSRYFDFIDNSDISAICYINTNWDALPMFKSFKWKDCRLGSNKLVADKWSAEMRKFRYLQSSGDLYESIGFTETR